MTARLPGARWARSGLWAALGLAAAVGLVRLVSAFQDGLSGGHDFVQDYAAIRALVEGRNPYEPYNDMAQRLFGGPPHRGPLYSFHAPSSLIFFLPLAPLPYGAAFVAWGLASLLCLWAICWLTLAALGRRPAAVLAAPTAVALVALPPIRENFVEGQINVVVAAGMLGSWAALQHGRPTLAGGLLGAAFALKPLPGLLFAYLLWRRQWRALLAACAALAAFILVGVGLAGWDGTIQYATVNYPDHANVWPAYPDNASIRGFFTRIFGPSDWKRPVYPVPGAAMVAWLASSLLCLGLFVLAAGPSRRTGSGAWLELAALLIATLLVTPIVWPHYYVVATPAILVLAAHLLSYALGGSRSAWAGVAALAGASAVLATARYVEPYRGVGGQQLAALLIVYAITLVTLAGDRLAYRLGRRPFSSRYEASSRAPT